MALFPDDNGENDLFMSRTDPENPLGTHAPYSFELEGKVWPTVEHYFQGMKFTDDNRQEKVRNADTPGKAGKLGRKRHKSLRRDWKQVRETVMTRGSTCAAEPIPSWRRLCWIPARRKSLKTAISIISGAVAGIGGAKIVMGKC